MNKMTNALMRKKYPATLTLEEVFKQVLSEHKYLKAAKLAKSFEQMAQK